MSKLLTGRKVQYAYYTSKMHIHEVSKSCDTRSIMQLGYMKFFNIMLKYIGYAMSRFQKEARVECMKGECM